MAARGLAETGDAAFIGNLAPAHLLLAHAHRRDLRHRIDAIGEEFRRRGRLEAEGVAGGDAALLHRGGGEAGKADDVTGGVDVRHRGLERLRLDADAPAMIDREARRLQVQPVGGADPAGGEEQHVGLHRAPVRQPADRPLVGAELDGGDGGAEAQPDIAVAQLVDELLDQLLVDEVEEAVARLDQRHRHVERREDRGVFDADDPGADDGEAARQLRQVDDLVAVEHRAAVEGHIVRPEGPRADGDEDVLAGVGVDVAVLLGDLDGVRIEEAGLAARGLHAVAGELVLQHLDLVVERLVQARHQVGGADVLLHPVGAAVEAALAPAGEVEHGLAQRLGRDGAGVDGDPADAAALLDDQNGPADLGGLHGGAAPGGAAADDNHVVIIHGRRQTICGQQGLPSSMHDECQAWMTAGGTRRPAFVADRLGFCRRKGSHCPRHGETPN